MAYTQETRTYTALFTATLDDHRAELADQVHDAIPLIWFLKNRGRGRDRGAGRGIRMYTGGARIKIPVISVKNPNVKSYSKFENLTVNASDEMTVGIEDMKNLATAVGISGEEMDQNRGLAAKRDLLRDKLDIAEIGLKEEFERQLVQGEVASGALFMEPGNSGKDMNPLGAIIIKDPTDTQTLHGITQAETWWANKVKQGAAAGAAAGSLEFVTEMNNLYHQCAMGSTGDAPDVGISDMYYYEYYETTMMNNQRYINRDEAATTAGFDNVRFKNMTLFWSEYVPSLGTDTTTADVTKTQSADEATAFFLNTRWLSLVISDAVNFIATPFVEPYDQDAIWSKILVRAQFITNQRRKLGCHFAVDTTAP